MNTAEVSHPTSDSAGHARTVNGSSDATGQIRHRRAYDNVLQTIGWTPLIRLSRVTRGIRTPVFGKADFFNPGGSVKDRIGLPLIESHEKSGALKPGGTIVEATSGNTGVGLAIAAALKGYKCIFTMPDKMSQEKVRLLRAFGAEVIITPTAVAHDHPQNYVMMAKRIAAETPGAVLAGQFDNLANPEAHVATTGPELWEQTEGRITHFVASAGTGGTISGVGRYLKSMNPKIKIIAADPQGSVLAELWRTNGEGHPTGAPYKVEGIGQDCVPHTLDMSIIDEFLTVGDKEAFAMARRLTREEGLFVGGSAGLIAHAAMHVARRIDDPDALVVTFLCDTGERYLSKVFNDEWMRENQLLDTSPSNIANVLGLKDSSAPAIVSVTSGATVRQSIRLMVLHNVSQVPVMDGAVCVGSVTESHLTSSSLADPKTLDVSVSDVMEPPFPTVEAGQSVESVAKLLSKSNRAVLVKKDNMIQGIVTRFDVLEYLMAR
ncbi:MAG: pyridoxal-phosphate dependent enzyme [Gemmatimonadaceae bacterium]